jgi:hypothetical protein
MDLVSAGTKRLDSNGGLSLLSEKQSNSRSMLLLLGEEKSVIGIMSVLLEFCQ